ncbi:MAG: hypothetical protein ACREHD_34235, partial [Pirellulales bacterium]
MASTVEGVPVEAPVGNARPTKPPSRGRRLIMLTSAAALIAGTVFFIQTNNGTIRVEINDPQIEVTIQGTDLTLKQADNGADVKLSPGEKTLVVERGDLKFETDKLVLRRGDAVAVNVTFVAGQVEVKHGDTVIGRGQIPAADALAAGDPNVELFNWVKQVGGRQEFLLNGKLLNVTDPSEIKDLLPDGPHTLISSTYWNIDLNDCQKVTDADMWRFKPITKTLRLVLDRTDVGDAGCEALHGLPTLLGLYLLDTHVTGDGIAKLGSLTNLQHLNLIGTRTSDEDLELLSHFPKLERIELGARHLTDRGALFLKNLERLNFVYLAPDVGAREIARLATLPQLIGLCIIGGGAALAFDDACLEHLKPLSRLKVLVIPFSSITDAGITRLPDVAPQIDYIDLGATTVT